MLITRAVLEPDRVQPTMFTIEVDDNVPISEAKRQADEVQLALRADLTGTPKQEVPEPWARSQASRMLTSRIRAERDASQARLPVPSHRSTIPVYDPELEAILADEYPTGF